MNKLRILIFIDWYKPGFKAGGPIRSISNLVSQLTSEFDFYIVTRNTDYLETTPYSSIKSDEWNKVDNANVYYLSKELQTKSKVKDLINEVKPHTIYCNSLYSVYYTLFPIWFAKKQNIKSVLAVRGMLSKGSLSVKSFKKKIFLKLIIGFGLFNETLFHATNKSEKEDILNNIGGKTKVVVAQNLPENKSNLFIRKLKSTNNIKMVFVGRIAPEKNLQYGIDLLKYCKKNIELDIFGPIYSKEYYQHCLNSINLLPSNIVVKYKGVLNPDMLDKTLEEYHILYLPSTGENYGHSIIEGMINSCIPVISNKTPWQNLEEKMIGFDIDLNKPKNFSESIDKLAEMNNEMILEYAKNAFLYAESIINNPKLKEDYNKLFKP